MHRFALRTISRIAARSVLRVRAPVLRITQKGRRFGTSSSSAPVAPSGVRGMLTVDQLKEHVAQGKIDQVIVGFTDMYGRMMGKRFDAEFFLNSALSGGTHGCDYLLASDMEMDPIHGFEYANWERGYGDFHLVPDMSSLRICSWHDKAAMVICDVMDDRTHELVPYAPRSILRKQIERANKAGFSVMAASELEYYLYNTTYREAFAKNYRFQDLKPVSDYVEDYHLLQSAREEKWNAPFRRHLQASGVPVETSKAEAGVGQHELNIKFAEVLTMGDRHTVYKQCLKEVAEQLGASVTFMSKPFSNTTGSGCHIHLSLHNKNDGKNVFPGNTQFGPVKCSDLFKWFLGGWLKYTPEMMVFYAGNINSYKRFVSASWAPTRLAWSYDNRTAGFRVVGSGKSLRIENRIAGADANIYLAFAASLASGLEGIAQRIEPPPIFEGNIYEARQVPEVPKTLHKAVDLFERSDFTKRALGDNVVRHYAHFFKSEQAAYDKFVTDWERVRYFERI